MQPIEMSAQKGPEEASNPPPAPTEHLGKWRPQGTQPGFQTWLVYLWVLCFLHGDWDSVSVWLLTVYLVWGTQAAAKNPVACQAVGKDWLETRGE